MVALDRTERVVTRMRMLAMAGLAAYLVVALAVLLSPVSPEALVAAVWQIARDDLGWPLGQGSIEFAANVALFVPFGVLMTLAARRPWAGVVAALVLSAAVEFAQIAIPGRLASPRDVLANVLGAAVGAAIVMAVRGMRRHTVARRSGDARPAATPRPVAPQR